MCNNKKIVGEEIARLKHALELFKTAQTRSGDYTLFEDSVGRVQRAHDEAVKDNNFIYHEAVPDVRLTYLLYITAVVISWDSIFLM